MSDLNDPSQFLPDQSTSAALIETLTVRPEYEAVLEALCEAVKGRRFTLTLVCLAELFLDIGFQGEERGERSEWVIEGAMALFQHCVLDRGHGPRQILEFCATLLLATAATSEFRDALSAERKEPVTEAAPSTHGRVIN